MAAGINAGAAQYALLFINIQLVYAFFVCYAHIGLKNGAVVQTFVAAYATFRVGIYHAPIVIFQLKHKSSPIDTS
jgi:hypothetical protein